MCLLKEIISQCKWILKNVIFDVPNLNWFYQTKFIGIYKNKQTDNINHTINITIVFKREHISWLKNCTQHNYWLFHSATAFTKHH